MPSDYPGSDYRGPVQGNGRFRRVCHDHAGEERMIA
jgi:hypothetical protein